MYRRLLIPFLVLACVVSATVAFAENEGRREFSAAAGGLLNLDLDAGGSVSIRSTGGSSIIVEYSARCKPDCDVSFKETGSGLTVTSKFVGRGKNQNSNVELEIQVPSMYDVELHSMGGELSIDGVDGQFSGKTMGGALTLHGVRGEAELVTMGGRIKLTDSELDGSLKTMGGEVLFEDVIGNVKGSSMGGDILIDSVDGWVQAITMGGDIEVHVVGNGGDVLLSSNSGDIELCVPSRFGMEMDLEIAFTKNSRKEYEIVAPGDWKTTETPDWDYDHGSPRKFIRGTGSAHGGGNTVKITTINGNITVKEGC